MVEPKSDSPSQVQIEIASALQQVRLLARALRAIIEEHCPPAVAADVELAVVEWANNLVEHGYGAAEGRITTLLRLEPDRLEIEVRDRGHPFDPTSEAGPDLESLDAEAESGRGLLLLQALMDELHYETVAGENRLRLVKRFPTAAD